MYLKGLSADGNTLTLQKFSGEFSVSPEFTQDWIATNWSHLSTGLAFDVETTGLDVAADKIIEIGVTQFKFDRRSGHVVKIEATYSGLEDPQEPLAEDIKKVTHLTDAMLKGQQIDWENVSQLFKTSDLIIAHNAAFDRGFADRKIPSSKEKVWACSCHQIDWLSKGFVGKGLTMLCISHGYFYESHRALTDANALLYLLTMVEKSTGKPYLHELLEEARKPLVQIVASSSPFETKDLLKRRGYRWNGGIKAWFCVVEEAKEQTEVKWLEETVYNRAFPGSVKRLRRSDNFKQSLDI